MCAARRGAARRGGRCTTRRGCGRAGSPSPRKRPWPRWAPPARPRPRRRSGRRRSAGRPQADWLGRHGLTAGRAAAARDGDGAARGEPGHRLDGRRGLHPRHPRREVLPRRQGASTRPAHGPPAARTRPAPGGWAAFRSRARANPRRGGVVPRRPGVGTLRWPAPRGPGGDGSGHRPRW
jgi:hypothetical protein